MTTEFAKALTAVQRAIDTPNADPTEFMLAAETLLGIVATSGFCLLGLPSLLSCRVMQSAGNTDNTVRGMVTTAAQVGYLLGVADAQYGYASAQEVATDA